MNRHEDREKAPCLRELPALPEDQGSISSIPTQTKVIYKTRPRESEGTRDAHGVQTHTKTKQTDTYN